MEQIEILKYRDLPPRIKKAMKNLQIKSAMLKEIKKVYWGGYILKLHDSAGWAFKTADLVSNEVQHIENMGFGTVVAIKPKMREHDVVRLSESIEGCDIPVGAEGTVVHMYDSGPSCEVEFSEYKNTVKMVYIENLKVLTYY